MSLMIGIAPIYINTAIFVGSCIVPFPI